jgi:hypothetical protein
VPPACALRGWRNRKSIWFGIDPSRHILALARFAGLPLAGLSSGFGQTSSSPRCLSALAISKIGPFFWKGREAAHGIAPE